MAKVPVLHCSIHRYVDPLAHGVAEAAAPVRGRAA